MNWKNPWRRDDPSKWDRITKEEEKETLIWELTKMEKWEEKEARLRQLLPEE